MKIRLNAAEFSLLKFGIDSKRTRKTSIETTPIPKIRRNASMGGMHTNFSVPSAFKINEMILTLGPNRFLQIRI